MLYKWFHPHYSAWCAELDGLHSVPLLKSRIGDEDAIGQVIKVIQCHLFQWLLNSLLKLVRF